MHVSSSIDAPPGHLHDPQSTTNKPLFHTNNSSILSPSSSSSSSSSLSLQPSPSPSLLMALSQEMIEQRLRRRERAIATLQMRTALRMAAAEQLLQAQQEQQRQRQRQQLAHATVWETAAFRPHSQPIDILVWPKKTAAATSTASTAGFITTATTAPFPVTKKVDQGESTKVPCSPSSIINTPSTSTPTTSSPLSLDPSPPRMNFPRILMSILSSPSSEGIIEWSPSGRSFVIVDRHRFASEVLPSHFDGTCKLSSFSRKLHRWGFRFERATHTYAHPYFQRDQPRLLQQMYTREGKLRRTEPAAKQKFPELLWKVLADEEHRRVLAWRPNGRGFVLLDPQALQDTVLPKQFGGKSQFASFARKLNRWGFRLNRETGTYSHPCFRRDEPGLLQQMTATEGSMGRCQG